MTGAEAAANWLSSAKAEAAADEGRGSRASVSQSSINQSINQPTHPAPKTLPWMGTRQFSVVKQLSEPLNHLGPISWPCLPPNSVLAISILSLLDKGPSSALGV